MKITQGTFSFLPELSDQQIRAQVEYCLRRGFALNVEHTDEPHPRNSYWEMWNMPMFDNSTADAVIAEVRACRTAFPAHYIKLNAYNSTRGVESVALSFIVNRPPTETQCHLLRQDSAGRDIRYALATETVKSARTEAD